MHLKYPEKTVYQMIEAAAGMYPKEPAFDFYGRRTNYREFLSDITAAARGLASIGVCFGSRVTICLPNIPQALAAFYAVSRLGAAANMLHPLSAEAEIVHALDLADSSWIITADMFYEKVRRAADRSGRQTHIVMVRLQDALPLHLKLPYLLRAGRKYLGRPDPPDLLWRDMLRKGAGVSLPKVEFEADHTACILYSGGTTGTPKGVCLTDMNLNACGLQTREIVQENFRPGLTMLACMPIFHGFGLGINIHAVLIHGACCILMPTFNSRSYADMLLKRKPSFIAGVPAIFEALLGNERLKNADLSFLLGVFCGGDSLPPVLKERVDAFLKERGASVQVREGYGLTECVTASCLTPRDTWRPGSIGLPFPDMVYDIAPLDRPGSCPTGETGEIVLKGPTVMQGYLNDEAETALALRRREDGDLWLYTGDLGRMDADGYVYFLQRIKRVIITNGYNVYPSRLEEALDACPEISLSCVIGVPNPRRGQVVRAYAVLEPGVPQTAETKEAIMKRLKERVAAYALPKSIEFRASLPRTLVGKVAYHELEREALAEASAGKETIGGRSV